MVVLSFILRLIRDSDVDLRSIGSVADMPAPDVGSRGADISYLSFEGHPFNDTLASTADEIARMLAPSLERFGCVLVIIMIPHGRFCLGARRL